MATLRSRINAWIHRHRLELALGFLIFLFLFIYAAPSIFVNILPGQTGVLWKRFGGGTATGPFDNLGEGLRLKFPWDKLFIYNARLQVANVRFEALSSDGLPLEVETTVRFAPIPYDIGNLHRVLGPDYVNALLLPEIGALVRQQFGLCEADELYSENRAIIQENVRKLLICELTPGAQCFIPPPEPDTEAPDEDRLCVKPFEFKEAPEETETSGDGGDPDGSSAAPKGTGVLSTQKRFRNIEKGSSECEDENGTNFCCSERDAPTYCLLEIDDVRIRDVRLPDSVRAAITAKIKQKHLALEYEFRLEREKQEKLRKEIEAQGIRLFQDIVAEGINEQYLKWKGIDATLELAKSHNAKVVMIGGTDGLPIILNLDSLPAAAQGGASQEATAAPPASSVLSSPPPAGTPTTTLPGAVGTTPADTATPASTQPGAGAAATTDPAASSAPPPPPPPPTVPGSQL